MAEITADAEVQDPGISKHVLVEAVGAVRHLCDQYELNYEDVLAEGSEPYRHQRERDLRDLESQG